MTFYFTDCFHSIVFRFGRRPCFIGVSILMILARFAQIFSPNILVYIISRFFVGAAHIGNFTFAFVLGKYGERWLLVDTEPLLTNEGCSLKTQGFMIM